jgi:hypothetical protein
MKLVQLVWLFAQFDFKFEFIGPFLVQNHFAYTSNPFQGLQRLFTIILQKI